MPSPRLGSIALISGICLLGQDTGGALAQIKMDVTLVPVACSVTNRDGTPVKGLTAGDFVLREEGAVQPIKYVWQDLDLPLTIGVIVDVSGSQMKWVEEHRNSVAQFITQVIGPHDRAFLVTVARDQRLLVDFTNSKDTLMRGVDRIDRRQRGGRLLGEPCVRHQDDDEHHGRHVVMHGCGGTTLWNSIYYAARDKMKRETGRKALVVLSDGMDTGSNHGLSDAIEMA